MDGLAGHSTRGRRAFRFVVAGGRSTRTGWVAEVDGASGRRVRRRRRGRSLAAGRCIDGRLGRGWLLLVVAALASSSAECRGGGDSHAHVLRLELGPLGGWAVSAEYMSKSWDGMQGFGDRPCRDERRCPVPRRLGGSLTRDLVLRGGGTARGEEMHGRGSTVYSLS